MAQAEKLVFSRPLSRWGWLIFLLPSTPSLAMLLGLHYFWSLVKLAEHPTSPLFGPLALGGGLVVALLTPPVGFFLLVPWLRRRYGHCEIVGDQATFHLALTPKAAATSVSLSEVVARTVTPAGIVLEASGRGRFQRLMFPLFVPTLTEEDVARVVQLLDAREPLPDRPQRDFVHGRTRLRPIGFAAVAFVLATSFVPPLIVGLRFGLDFGMAFGMPFFLLTTLFELPALIVLELKTVYLLERRLNLGEDALIFGIKRIPYGELRLVAAADGLLAFQWGKKRFVAPLGEALPAAAAVLREKLAATRGDLEVASELPVWATRSRQRRIVLAVVAVWCLLTLGVVALVSLPRPVYDEALNRLGLYEDKAQTDLKGLSLHVVFGRGDRKPRFLLLQTGKESDFNYRNDTIRVPGLTGKLGFMDDVLVDLREGTGKDKAGSFTFPRESTLLHIMTGGRRVSSDAALPEGLVALVEGAAAKRGTPDSLPELLEPLLRGVTDPVLRDFILGRTSRRCYDVTDGHGERFVWAVDCGEAAFVARVPGNRGVDVALVGWKHSVSGSRPLVVATLKTNVYFVAADGSVESRSAVLPGLDELLAMNARIRAGATVGEATGALLAESH